MHNAAPDCECFLILDGFSGHLTDENDALLRMHHITKIVIPPHSSDKLQPLDLVGFSVLKRRIRITDLSCMEMRGESSKETRRQMEYIISIIDGIVATFIPRNIIAAFRAGGIDCVVSKQGDHFEQTAQVDRTVSRLNSTNKDLQLIP